MSSSSMLSSSAVHRKGGNSFIAAENASAQRSVLRQPRLASTPSSVASTTTTTTTTAVAATGTAAAAPSPPQSPSAHGPHPSQSLWQQLSVPTDMAQAWTLSFEQLAGEYLSRLAELVDAYGGNGSSADAMAGHSDGAASARPPPISRSVRRTGLGGSAAEDAALELNVEDLRCVEHALLSELQAYQSHGSTSTSPVLDAQAGRREAASTQAVQRDATSATPTARPSRVPAVPGMKQRGDEEGGVALTRGRSVTSEHTGAVAVVGGGEREETGGSDGDPRPLPDSVLALFRQAQLLSAEKQQQSMVGAASPVKDFAAAATQLSASDETEAEALARLCVKYFYTPKAAPAPVTAPPPLPTADRPWSSSPTAAAAAGAKGRRRSSGRTAQPMRGRGAAAVPPPHHHPDYSERRGNPSFPDTALFPPPNLHPNTQRKQQRIAPAPPATQPRISFANEGGGMATDAAIPMSINSPAAWRKLIEKRSAAAASSSGGGGGGASPASAAPATATAAAASKPATSTAKGTALASLPHSGAAAAAARGVARRAASPATTTATATSRAPPEDVSAPEPDTNFSFGFPPPRALFTAANVSEVLDALQTEGKDGPIRRYLGGKLGKQPAAVARAEERLGQPASQQQRQQQQQQPRLPALTAKAAPRVDEQGAVQAGGTGGGREGQTRSSHGQLPLSQHATGAASTTTAAAAPTVQATAQPKPPNGGNTKAESRRAAARVKGHLAPTVVLPPHYHGARGEHLTTAELEQLVASVTQESAAAQSSLERSNNATNAAADELYRLQKAVAETLLENVQLEKDIATLVTGSDGGAASTSRALTVVVGVGEGPAATTTTTEGAAVIAGKASSSHPSSSLVPAHRRAMLTLPAPHTAGNTGKGLATSSLLSTARSGTLTTSRRGNATLRAATVPPARLLSPTAAPASSHHSPLAILEELREATAAREAETAATLREIDALSDRIARHDALLHAVAEYWRRNAAVMKRQQFAVLAQPPLRPATVNSAGGLAVTWQSSNASRRNSHPGPASPSEYSHDSSDNSKDNSEGGRDSRSFVSRTDYSATPSGRVPELLGSPSQLERALAHMEAVSPMLPSSALSFDLHPSPSRTTENSSVPPTVKAQQRTTVRRQGAGGGDDGKEAGEEEEEEEAAAAVRSHWTQSQGTPQKLLGNARGTHQQHLQQQDEQLAQVEGVSSGSFLPSGAVSGAAHTATKRSLFGAPDAESDEDEEAVKRRESATASPPAPAVSGQQPTSTNNAADACSKKAAKLPSVTHVNGGGGSTVKGFDAAAVRLPPISQPALAKGTFDATQHAVGSPLPHLSSQHTGFASTANASRRGGEGEEEVLQPGSWRTIAALQLDNVDEIAEFIYSVFERA